MANKKQKGSNAWIYWMIGIIAAAVILIVVLDQQMSSNKVESITYEDQPVVGEEDAPVTIVEFYDYLCSHCQDYQEIAIPEIKQKLVENGKAKLVLVNHAFIGDSDQAARFVEATYQELGNESAVALHEHLLEARVEESGVFTDEYLKDALSEVVEDEEKVEQVATAYEDGAGKDALQKDKEIVSDLGVTSTPTLVIDGEIFDGATFEDLEKAVEEAAANKE